MSESRFALLPADAIDDPDLTLTDLRVLGVIGYHSSRKRPAWPKQATIAERLKLARETINRSIRRLQAKGYIHVSPQYRTDGGQRENHYFMRLDPDPIDQQVDDSAQGETQALDPPVIHTSQGGVTPEITPPVTSSVTPPVTPGITPKKNIPKEHTQRTHSPASAGESVCQDSKSKGKASGDTAAEFDALWEVWPDQGRERSQGHKACLKAFKAACEDHEPGRIVEAAAAFVARTKPQWVPGLHKWLAERKFEHFLPGASPAAEAPPARQRPELVRPVGRAGDCLDEIIMTFGMPAAEAWLGGTNWTDDEVQLPSEYDRLQVDQRFGGVLRRHGFAAGLQAS